MIQERVQNTSEKVVYDRVIKLLPNIFKKIINKNQNKNKRKSSKFDCTYQISICFDDYFLRLIKLMDPECNTLIYSLILIDTICNEDKIVLSVKNIHKVFFISLFISLKVLEDEIYNENHYSISAGISQKEIAILEIEFLNKICYDVLVTADKFNLYYMSFVKAKD
jgi:hypothetical protein